MIGILAEDDDADVLERGQVEGAEPFAARREDALARRLLGQPLPDLDLVKRIAAGDKRTSFVGSHFLYEDISGRAVQEDKHGERALQQLREIVRGYPGRKRLRLRLDLASGAQVWVESAKQGQWLEIPA